eukprot:CAMPEP_0201892074 /NCGR_PEP_ID=MMETSP0902-20130614/35722_1 /ASSEMBLY_ACC=CAM_ASM_000551 /TAXON_ID=420261 /ORGANISM="Thalassiosira antarctica, Strain CCMP982" /LENGTH=344 /DNA_ID=CAMNT_0048423435 /DNA_START=38 /DNA_END=1072 /DNA_ORIENTATION=-
MTQAAASVRFMARLARGGSTRLGNPDPDAWRKLRDMEYVDLELADAFWLELKREQYKEQEDNIIEEKKEEVIKKEESKSHNTRLNPNDIDRVPNNIREYLPAVEKYVTNEWLSKFPEGAGIKRLRNDLAFRMDGGPSPKKKLDPDIVKSIAGEVARMNDSIQLWNTTKGTVKSVKIMPSPSPEMQSIIDSEGGDDLSRKLKKTKNKNDKKKESRSTRMNPNDINPVNRKIRPYLPAIEEYMTNEWRSMHPGGAGIRQFWGDLKEGKVIPKRLLSGEIMKSIAGELARKGLVQLGMNRKGKIKLMPLSPEESTAEQSTEEPMEQLSHEEPMEQSEELTTEQEQIL